MMGSFISTENLYSCSRFCTINCQPLVSNFPMLGLEFELHTSEVEGECVTTVLLWPSKISYYKADLSMKLYCMSDWICLILYSFKKFA